MIEDEDAGAKTGSMLAALAARCWRRGTRAPRARLGLAY